MMYLVNNKKFSVVIKRSSIFLLLFCLIACQKDQQKAETVWTGKTMGTVYNIRIVHNNEKQFRLDSLKVRIDQSLITVNQQMSTYIADSEISRFNRLQTREKFLVSEPFGQVIASSLEIFKLSGGAFDITVAPLVNLWGFGTQGKRFEPPADLKISEVLNRIGSQKLQLIENTYLKKLDPLIQIDLGAIAKGYGVDVVAGEIEKFGITDFLVEIGGEIYAAGVNIKNESWHIGVDKPDLSAVPGQDLMEILMISGIGLATSGDYRNYFQKEGKIYSHTIDPKTGRPVVHNLASVTILTNSCMRADALATAVSVLGPDKGMDLIESLENTESMLIERKESNEFKITYSSGFEKYIFKNQ